MQQPRLVVLEQGAAGFGAAGCGAGGVATTGGGADATYVSGAGLSIANVNVPPRTTSSPARSILRFDPAAAFAAGADAAGALFPTGGSITAVALAAGAADRAGAA